MGRSSNMMEAWRRARLLSTAGIKEAKEQEARATSALLAVMAAVPSFGHELLADLGAPRGHIETYTEVPLKTAGNAQVFPDGAIVARRGKKSWSALVEVKTGKSPLDQEQVVSYLDIARRDGFDGVLIINNDILGGAQDVPIKVPRNKLRTVILWQLSWWRILTEAVIQHQHRGISDPEQAWILGELIAYLVHENSGAGEFDDMGPSWTTVRDGARHETLSKRQDEVSDIARRWEQFVHYVSLGLTQELGKEVVPARVKKDLDTRLQETIDELVDHGRLSMELKVPNAVGPMELHADLRTRMVTTSVPVKAPGEGRPDTRVRWMLRQLRKAPDDLRVEVRFERTSNATSALLGDIRDDAKALLLPNDRKRAPREFHLSLSRPMGTKRTTSRDHSSPKAISKPLTSIVNSSRTWWSGSHGRPSCVSRARRAVLPTTVQLAAPATRAVTARTVPPQLAPANGHRHLRKPPKNVRLGQREHQRANGDGRTCRPR